MRLTYNDRQHAYWLDGKRCKGVTTVAKIPDDRYRLELYGKRMVAAGMATNPVLVKRAAAHHDDRDQLDIIAEEALVAAKAMDAAGLGTAAHRVTERIDLGQDWIDTPEHRHIEQQWTTALKTAGLEIIPEYTEQIVVYPDNLVCGRFDRICRVVDPAPLHAAGYDVHTGDLVVVDLKTGDGAIRYPHSTCIQLGLYAHAPLVAVDLTRDKKGNEVTETFKPLPSGLHPAVGVIVYLPAEGDAEVYGLDIAAGWDTARNICFPTIAWRKANGLVAKVASECGISEAALPVEPAAAADQDPGGAGHGDAGVWDDTPASPDRIQWLRARVQAIKDAGHLADLHTEWPPDTPGFRSTPPLSTDRHVSLVADACSKVEAKWEMPFGTVDPLFACFFNAPAGDTIHERPATVDVAFEADRAEAKAWADKARRLLERWEPGDQLAIAGVAHVDPKATMTEAMYLRLAAVDSALDRGLLDWQFGPYGPSIVVADGGAMLLGEHTKTGVLARAKPVARELGIASPRRFDDVASSPTLAALVAYSTTPNTNITGKQEQ